MLLLMMNHILEDLTEVSCESEVTSSYAIQELIKILEFCSGNMDVWHAIQKRLFNRVTTCL